MLKDEMANNLLNTIKLIWNYMYEGSEHLDEYEQPRRASDQR